MLPLLLPDSPVAVLVADRPAGRPGRRPARRPGPAADHRLRRRQPRPAPRRCTSSARRTPRATPTWRGPGSPRGARCSPRRWTSTRSKVTGASVAAERISPSADLLAAWLADRLKVDVERQHLRRPRHHRGGDGDQARARSGSPAPTAGSRRSPPRRSRTGRSRSSGATCPSCSPRSCAGSTRTTCTPPTPRARCTAPRRQVGGDRAVPPGRGPRGRRTRWPPPWPASCSPGSPTRRRRGEVPQIALTGGTIADAIHREVARRRRRPRGLDAGGGLVGRRALRAARHPERNAGQARDGVPRRGRRWTRRTCTRCRRRPTAADVEEAAAAYADAAARARRR